MILVSWKDSKSFVWDVTCVDTLTLAPIGLFSTAAGKAAEHAEQLKVVVKHSTLLAEYCFRPVGFETLRAWGSAARNLLTDISQRVKGYFGERRSFWIFNPKNCDWNSARQCVFCFGDHWTWPWPQCSVSHLGRQQAFGVFVFGCCWSVLNKIQ